MKAVSSDAPPRYERRATESSFVAFESRVRALLVAEPELPATVLAERVGWDGSLTWFRENVKRLRPEHRRIDSADWLVWEPATRRSAICGSAAKDPVGGRESVRSDLGRNAVAVSGRPTHGWSGTYELGTGAALGRSARGCSVGIRVEKNNPASAMRPRAASAVRSPFRRACWFSSSTA